MSIVSNSVLAYATPIPRRRLGPIYAKFLVMTAIPAFAVWGLLVLFVPKFVAVFRQFGGTLPALARIVISASRAAQNIFLLPLYLAILVTLPLVLAIDSRRRDARGERRISNLYFLFLLLLTVGAIGTIVAGMLAPIGGLQEMIK